MAGILVLVGLITGGFYIHNKGEVKDFCDTVIARHDAFDRAYSRAYTDSAKRAAVGQYSLSALKVPHGPWTFTHPALEKKFESLSWNVALMGADADGELNAYYRFKSECPK